MDIKPKAGRLATGAYTDGHSPIAGEVFRSNNDTQLTNLPDGPGGIVTKPNKNIYASPLVKQYAVSTIRNVPSRTTLQNAFPFTWRTKPAVQPQTRSILSNKVVEPVVRMVFGGSPDMPSDTPFHPINQPRPAPIIRSERNGERHNAASFDSINNLWGLANNSFYDGQPQIGDGRIGRGRWDTIKKGAV